MNILHLIKKISYLLVTILIFVCVILFFTIKTEQGRMETEAKTIFAEEMSTYRMYNCHYVAENAEFVIDGADPNIIFPSIDEPINCISIEFVSPLSRTTPVQLFYAKSGEIFSEENSILTVIRKGDKSINFFFPTGTYSQFRLDFDGAFTLESLSYGMGSIDIGEEFRIIRYEKINWVALVIVIVTFALLKFFERNYGYYHFIKHISKTLMDKLKKTKLCERFSKKFIKSNDFKYNDDIKARKTANVFAILALVFGVIMIYIVPPMSSPDENGHFQNICRISSGNVFADVGEDGTVGSNLASAEINFISDSFSKYVWNYQDNLYSYTQIGEYCANYKYSGQTLFYPTGHSTINPASYFSACIGVVIVKALFGISNVYSLWVCARLSNLLFSILVIRLAILKTPIMRNTMFLLALMPMTFFQLCSVNYDVELICGAFLLFSYSMRLILADKTYRVSTSDIAAICFACGCLFAAKLYYIVLAIILFSICIKKFGSWKRYVFSIGCVVCMGVIFYLIPTIITNNAIGSTMQNPMGGERYEALFENYQIIPSIVWKSLYMNKGLCITSFIGYFGWLNVGMPNSFIYFYILVISSTAIIELCMIRRLNIRSRVLGLVSSVIIIAALVVVMYVSFWGYGTFYARGLQGRYFIPIALYNVIWLANPLLCRFKYTDKIYAVLDKSTKCVAAAYCMLTCAIIFTAYWL